VPDRELVDRYLYAVRSGLPKGQQDDIIAELAEDIRSQIEDLESGLGRGLNETEVVDMLKERGHPEKVASRYLPQQYVIGPAIYPAYLFVLKLVIAIQVPIIAFIVGPIEVMTSTQPSHAIVQAAWNLAMAVVFTIGIITLVFAIIERYPAGPLPFDKWDPRKLPRVPKTPPAARSTPRVTAIAEVACSLVFTTFYVAWFRMTFDIGGAHFVLKPIWSALYWAFLAVMLSGAVKGYVGLMWPERVRLRFWMRVAINAASVALSLILLNAGSWIDFTIPGVGAAELVDAVKWTNFGIKIFLIVCAVIAAGDAIPEGMRIFGKKSSWNYSIAT